jgi:uncharacterized membrane protein YccC
VTNPSPVERRAVALKRWLGISYDLLVRIRFAINVFLATTIIWIVLRYFDDTNPIWAIASSLAASDPEPGQARRLFRARLINVVVGCLVGFVFLLVFGGTSQWILPLSLATAVLISTNLVRVETMWRQAPITTAIMLAGAITPGGSTSVGIERGLHKVAEVIFGCLVGVCVSLVMSRLWLIRPETPAAEPD